MSPSYHRAGCQDIDSSVTTSAQTLSVGNRGNYYHTHCWCGNRDQYVTNCTCCWCGNRDQYVTNCTYCWCGNRDQYVTNCTYCWCGNRDQHVTNCTYCWLRTETSTLPVAHTVGHTPSTAFRHLPPNSARFSYATEGALFLSAQLSSDAASALRKFPVASTVILTVEAT